MTATEKYRTLTLVPPGTRHGNPFWWVRGNLAGRRVEMSSRRTEKKDAQTFVDDLLDGVNGAPLPHFLPTETGIPKWASKLWAAAKYRCRGNGVLFDLTEDDMRALVKRAHGCCTVTGIPFSTVGVMHYRQHPFAPSLDRIVPAKGYTLGNCRLVGFAVNVAMSDWGELVLFKISAGVLRNMRGREN